MTGSDKAKKQQRLVFGNARNRIARVVAVLPLIVVANYSFYNIFHIDTKTWVGLDWYRDVLGSVRYWQTLGRSLLFFTMVLAIEIPLGIAIALAIPKKGVVERSMPGLHILAATGSLEYDYHDLACVSQEYGPASARAVIYFIPIFVHYHFLVHDTRWISYDPQGALKAIRGDHKCTDRL